MFPDDIFSVFGHPVGNLDSSDHCCSLSLCWGTIYSQREEPQKGPRGGAKGNKWNKVVPKVQPKVVPGGEKSKKKVNNG